jgi:hypothetical protein
MVEGVLRSAPVLPFQVKMEMRMQSLDLHSSLVKAVVAVDGMPLGPLAEIILVARVVQTMLLVHLVVTLVLVAVVVAQGKQPVEVALSES